MSSIINILSGMSSRIKITALLPENADDSATLIQKLGIDLFYNDYLFFKEIIVFSNDSHFG
jgi:hypothetical protein